MNVDPAAWPESAGYFRFFSEGRRDQTAGSAYTYRAEDARQSSDNERLNIGRARVDGVEFVYRRESPGIWACNRLEGDTEWKADDIYSYEQAWRAGSIKV